MKNNKKVKITKNDIGRYVTTKWIDSGRLDGILVEVNGDFKHKYAKVFHFESRAVCSVDFDQFIEKRGYCNAG